MDRCKVCNKKVGIVNRFECRCDKDRYFCSIHRYPEEHNCSIDHKLMERLELQKNLEKIVAKKITSF